MDFFVLACGGGGEEKLAVALKVSWPDRSPGGQTLPGRTTDNFLLSTQRRKPEKSTEKACNREQFWILAEAKASSRPVGMGSVDMKRQTDRCSVVVRVSSSEVRYILYVRPPRLSQCTASPSRPAKPLFPLLEFQPHHSLRSRETFSPTPACTTIHYATRHFAHHRQPPLRT
jgi:hypothetical protein